MSTTEIPNQFRYRAAAPGTVPATRSERPSVALSTGATTQAPSRALECLAACVPKRLVQRCLAAPASRAAVDESAELDSSRRAHLQCSFFNAALLFVDISGFTSSMERFAVHGGKGIERFWSVINKYFSHLLLEIYSRGGDVECFAGDAMLVSFGADAVAVHPVGEQILAAYLRSQQADTVRRSTGRTQTEAQARLSVATRVAVDAVAAMLQQSPYRTTDF
eukprot:17482-Heterococcus_DN1.PRE.1